MYIIQYKTDRLSVQIKADEYMFTEDEDTHEEICQVCYGKYSVLRIPKEWIVLIKRYTPYQKRNRKRF